MNGNKFESIIQQIKIGIINYDKNALTACALLIIYIAMDIEVGRRKT